MMSELSYQLHLGQHYAAQLFQGLWVKLSLGALLALFVPHHDALLAVALLCGIDFICGFSAAVRMRTVSSGKMRKGIVKLILYAVLLVVVVVTEQKLLDDITQHMITTAVLALLGITEALSIIENLILLGLPAPFGKTVLRFLSRKGKDFGLDIDGGVSEASVAADVLLMLKGHIPRLRSEPLRESMRVYYTHWYGLLTGLEVTAFEQDTALVWERFQALTQDNRSDIVAAVDRAGIPREFRDAFLTRWTDPVALEVMKACRQLLDQQPNAVYRVEGIRSVAVTSLYRINQLALMWDDQLDAGTKPSDVTVIVALPFVAPLPTPTNDP